MAEDQATLSTFDDEAGPDDGAVTGDRPASTDGRAGGADGAGVWALLGGAPRRRRLVPRPRRRGPAADVRDGGLTAERRSRGRRTPNAVLCSGPLLEVVHDIQKGLLALFVLLVVALVIAAVAATGLALGP